MIVHGGSLAFRRRWPLAVLAVMLVTAAIYTVGLDLPVYMLGPGTLEAYMVAAAEVRPRSLLALAIVELVMLTLIFVGPSFPDYSLALFAVLIGAAWFLRRRRSWMADAAIQHERRGRVGRRLGGAGRPGLSEERLRRPRGPTRRAHG